ncbi:MAG TPA: hypothetical protein VF623_12405 [Segetibacter sp.]|jgi:hypothetical protein
MKKLFFVLFSVLLFSCTKEKDSDAPEVKTFQTFLGKYMVCDSVKTTTNNISSTQVLGKGKGQDFLFGLYGNYTLYSNPEVNYNFQFEVPNKMYYWKDTYNANQYYIVNSMAGNKMVLQSNEANKTIIRYYTSE